jgi:hypothetical protein
MYNPNLIQYLGLFHFPVVFPFDFAVVGLTAELVCCALNGFPGLIRFLDLIRLLCPFHFLRPFGVLIWLATDLGPLGIAPVLGPETDFESALVQSFVVGHATLGAVVRSSVVSLSVGHQ